MRKKTRNLVIFIAAIVAVAGFLMLSGNEDFKTQVLDAGVYDSFAQCIDASGAQMYGAYWCPACENQKKSFGSAEQYLPYVECSLANSRQQTIECRKASIESYPTWEFSDGSRVSNLLSFEELAQRTNCPLPAEHESPDTEIAPTDVSEGTPLVDAEVNQAATTSEEVVEDLSTTTTASEDEMMAAEEVITENN